MLSLHLVITIHNTSIVIHITHPMQKKSLKISSLQMIAHPLGMSKSNLRMDPSRPAVNTKACPPPFIIIMVLPDSAKARIPYYEIPIHGWILILILIIIICIRL